MPGRRGRSRGFFLAYAFLAPALLFLGVLLGYPIIDTLYLSFTKFNYVYDSHPAFVGFANYVALAESGGFREALINTLLFTAMFLPLFVGLSLLAAITVNAVPRFGNIFRTPVFLPVIVGESVTGVIFSWIFSDDFGLFNQFLRAIGLGALARGWLSDPHFALAVIVVVELWMLLGVGMLIFLAGLGSIPREIYDAAAVDGAGPLQVFRHITVPNLRLHFVIVIIWALVQAIKVFGVPYVMTHGGPAGATVTLYLYVWNAAFRFFEMGRAAAVGYVIAALIFVFSAATYLIGRFGEPA
jgi:multiple sugar transport system permease protein